MMDPSEGITALAEASTVVIKARRGTEQVAAAATKLQAVYRGDKVRKKTQEPEPTGWFCCASSRKPKKWT